jgi:hypothetical protein
LKFKKETAKEVNISLPILRVIAFLYFYYSNAGFVFSQAISNSQAFALATAGISPIANGAISILPGSPTIDIAMDRCPDTCSTNDARRRWDYPLGSGRLFFHSAD